MAYLNSIPLSTPEIQQVLQAADIGWLEMLALLKSQLLVVWLLFFA